MSNPTQESEAPSASHHRYLTDHRANELNDNVTITVVDKPGSGNANHEYRLTLWPANPDGADVSPVRTLDISFQNGPIKEAGFNGFTNEALLAVIIDRMRGFQSGPFKSRENAIVLTHLEEGLMWLQKRTRDRMARGVEGTNVA